MTRTPRQPGRPRNEKRRSGRAMTVWIDEALMDAFAAYLDASEPRISKTSAVETALKEFLRSRGLWPEKS